MTPTAARGVAAVGLNSPQFIRGEELDWQLYGLCRGDDPSKWFPDLPGATPREAKAICRQCPVEKQCQQWALTRHEEYGVWGGLTEEERKSLWEGKPIRRRRTHRTTLRAWGVTA